MIRGLAEHIALFNRRHKIYTDPDCVAQTVSGLSLHPEVECPPRKPLLTRLRAFWTGR